MLLGCSRSTSGNRPQDSNIDEIAFEEKIFRAAKSNKVTDLRLLLDRQLAQYRVHKDEVRGSFKLFGRC